MKLANLRILYLISCGALCLIVLSPTIDLISPFPEGERYSELYVLGPTHLMEGYPFNISAGISYNFYLGVGNYMQDLKYYSVRVKFRNQSDSGPDSLSGSASSLAPFLEYRIFLRNNESWEREIVFSLNDVSYNGNVSRVSNILVDGYSYDVDKTAVRDEVASGYHYQLFFELWIYNSAISAFQYHNRFVGLWLNING